MEDNEQTYREFLAFLISRTKSRGNGRYYNKFMNKCREEAARQFPKGAAEAAKKDGALGGGLSIFDAFLKIFG